MLIVDFPIGCEVADDVIDGFDGEDVGPAVRKVSCGLSCPCPGRIIVARNK